MNFRIISPAPNFHKSVAPGVFLSGVFSLLLVLCLPDFVLPQVGTVVAPSRFEFKDVADAFVGEVSGCLDCSTLLPTEGFSDPVLKFKASDLIAALGSITNKECRPALLTGALDDGTPIEGRDFIITLTK